jgi:hypothetical protein
MQKGVPKKSTSSSRGTIVISRQREISWLCQFQLFIDQEISPIVEMTNYVPLNLFRRKIKSYGLMFKMTIMRAIAKWFIF